SGFGGQAYRPEAARRIAALRSLIGDRDGRPLPLHVDGGINSTTAGDAAVAGASLLVVGSALFSAQGATRMGGAIRAIREAATL
ncbi:MAG: ribulose-phosphate 3-epimerase, partial [Candidatus Limnocylindrus sp.]